MPSVPLSLTTYNQSTWVLSKLALGESKSYSDYYEFNHGEKTTFAIQITYLDTPLESARAMSNNRKELVVDEGEDTVLHANGEIFGYFTRAD